MTYMKPNYFKLYVGEMLSLIMITFACISWQAPAVLLESDSKGNNPIYLADPTIFFHDGTYYLYGTGGHNANQGFQVYTSTDMHAWEGHKGAHGGYALRKEDVYGDKGFWAPQVFQYQDKFYMAYTANENIAIAMSDSPLGPFTQASKTPLAAPVRQIDPFVFIDEDGKKYLYHVRLTEGNRIFVAEMEDDLSGIKPETLQEIITAEAGWENTANADWPVAEGPSVLKHNKLYYLFYAANDFRNPDYAVGYAVSDTPFGPWRKYSGNPILSKATTGENGSGHGDFTIGNQGQLYYVFHTHYSTNRVGPRKAAVVKARFKAPPQQSYAEDQLVMDAESFYFLQAEKEM
ncbi:beta-xylosidase [Flammeovirgaceae bacterium 311]|nr:beta-xylosidase [Flammeovirgaceae bacterium 311]